MEIRLLVPYKRPNGSRPEHPDMVDIRETLEPAKGTNVLYTYRHSCKNRPVIEVTVRLVA